MLLPLFSAASDQVYLLYSIVLFHSLHLSGLCVAQLGSILYDPMDCSPPASSVHGLFQARILEWGCHFLLQGVFLTQGSNWSLLHCRRILYCLSHQGSLDGSVGKESDCSAGNTGDVSSAPESGRPPGEGNGSPLQDSYLENPHGQRSLAGPQTMGSHES